MMRKTDKDRKKLKNINARLARRNKKLLASGIDVNIGTRSLGTFQSRKDFNNYIKEANKILNSKQYKLRKNPNGMVYSEQDKLDLEKALKERNNRKTKQWNMIKNLKTGGITIEELSKMVRDSKYASFTSRNKSINQFKNRDEFNRYMRMLKDESSPAKFNDKANLYKENLKTAIRSVYGDRADKIIKNIDKASTRKFLQYYYGDEFLSIDFIYDEGIGQDKRWAKLEKYFG